MLYVSRSQLVFALTFYTFLCKQVRRSIARSFFNVVTFFSKCCAPVPCVLSFCHCSYGPFHLLVMTISYSLLFISLSMYQAIEAAKVDKTDKPFNEMKIISIDIS